MPNVNPKMQPERKPELRTWQHADDVARAYAYGECPLCGETGDCTFEDGEVEVWECDCGAVWELAIAITYRFARLVEDED